MRQPVRWLGVVLLLLCGPPCFSQAITIRIVNEKNGKPLRGQMVMIRWINKERGARGEAKGSPPVSLKTDANGQVICDLPNPLPAYVDARIQLAQSRWDCGACSAFIPADRLIQEGMVTPTPVETAKRTTASIKANPGEIVFLARPYNFLEWLLYPLEKE